MSDLADIVRKDSALAVRIISVANSPAFLRISPSSDIVKCLANLGTRLARTLAACMVVQSLFSSKTGYSETDLTGYWWHSLLAAEISREIAVSVNYCDPEEAYVAALLHDVGQLLLLGDLEDEYAGLLESTVDEADLINCENMTLGTNHAVVGAFLAYKWQLPSFMADSILLHHAKPAEICSADKLSRIVWSAHALCEHKLVLESKMNNTQSFLEIIGGTLPVDIHDPVTILCNCLATVTAAAKALDICGSGSEPTTPQVSGQYSRVKVPESHSAAAGIRSAVCEMAIMNPLAKNLSSLVDEDELLLAVRESARMLFGLGNMAFFLRNKNGSLSGIKQDGQPAVLCSLEIPVDPPDSLIADSAFLMRPFSSFDVLDSRQHAVADGQIIRAMGSDGVLYLPLAVNEQLIGVIAFGMTAPQFSRNNRQLGWLLGFARVAAGCIAEWRCIESMKTASEELLVKRYEKHARKIVHESANPLLIINSYIGMISDKLSAASGIQEELSVLKEEISRVTKIIHQIKCLPEVAENDDLVEINTLIESMLALYGKALFSSKGITVRKSLDPLLPPLHSSSDSLKQIFVNLWNNASDAMPSGGCLSITTNCGVVMDGCNYIEIVISDTGPGLPQDVLLNLFKPLDADKRVGHSGLGLSIVAGLVESLKGTITCRSSAGQGTAFSILLPKNSPEIA